MTGGWRRERQRGMCRCMMSHSSQREGTYMVWTMKICGDRKRYLEEEAKSLGVRGGGVEEQEQEE